MRGLTLILSGDDPDRFDAALTLASTVAAGGARARIYFHVRAVLLLADPLAGPDDDARSAAGMPTLAQLRDEAVAIGVTFIACQSGLAIAGIAAEGLPPDVSTGGMVALLASLDEDRLILA